MGRVALYSVLLIGGMLLSQGVDLSPWRSAINVAGSVLLAYIMIEVGLEFSVDKKRLSSYGKDYLIAIGAAAIPWILCGVYFWGFLQVSFVEAVHVSRFAAPTSAGVLFAMLAAAGLMRTWVFKKARILAIFDDLDTVLIMIPLQMLNLGFEGRSLLLLGVIVLMLFLSYRHLHRLRLPLGSGWLLLYAAVLVAFTEMLRTTIALHLEILLPAFLFGCLLHNPRNPHQHMSLESKGLDPLLKLCYMFLVGCALPRIDLGHSSAAWLAIHVAAITLLSNLGKSYLFFFYRKEASIRERLALSIAMFPRGEVGAGVLLMATKYAIGLAVLHIAQLSLAVNLVLTGAFIYAVLWLLKGSLPLKKRAP